MQSHPPTRGANGAAVRKPEASEAPPMQHASTGGISGTDSEGSGSTVPAKSGMDAHSGGRERDNHRVRGGLSSGSVLGKRQEPEGGTSSGDSGATDMKEHIMRLSRDNKQLKSALSKSQEEVKKLKSVIEMHELQTKKSSKEDSKAATRYWTDAEHQRFLDALQAHGPKDVKAIAQQVGTRSATQVRTHAQKYFIKLARVKKSAEEAAKAGVPASAHGAWWLQANNPSAAPGSKGEEDEEEDMKEMCKMESSSTATLASMDSFKSDCDKSSSASSVDKAHEKRTSLRARMDHMSQLFQSAPHAISSRRSGGASDGLSGGGSNSSAKGMSCSTQKGRERVERGERAERVERVGREWQGVGAGAGAAGGSESVAGKSRCCTSLSSSSNEESGITDGSSTHGNGTSNGSWQGSSESASDKPSCPDTESSKHPSSTNSEGDSNIASNNGSDPSNNDSASDRANNSDGCSEASGDRWEGEEEAAVSRSSNSGRRDSEAPRGAGDKKAAGTASEEEGGSRRDGGSSGGAAAGVPKGSTRKGGVSVANLVA